MPYFRPTLFALILAVIFVAGCGSEQPANLGESRQATAPPGQGILTNTVPSGPGDPAANLERLLSESAAGLRNARVACPGVDDLPHYPFDCRFTAQSGRRGTGVVGEIVVHGVYAPTRTYVYETRYRPSDAR